MKKIIPLYLFIILAGSALIFSSCKKQLTDLSAYNPIGNTKSDSLRIYNLLPDISSINQNGYVLYVNDSLNYFTGTSFFNGQVYGAAPVITVPAQGGTFTIKLAQYPFSNPYSNLPPPPPAKNPDASAIVCQKTITVPPHSGFGDIIFYDSLANIPAVKYLPLSSADPGAPAPGTFKVRIINYSYAMAALGASSLSVPESAGPQYNLQLQYRDSTAVKGDENLPFGAVSNYQQIDYGTEQFLVYNLTTNAYIKNSGPFNDVLKTFDLSPLPSSPGYADNNLFPMVSDYTQYLNTSTLQTGNIGSYPFAAGGCYTIMVIGNMYSVSLDRRYGPGVLDNFGKVQVVNANPNQQDMEVKISYSGSQTDIPSLPFGTSTTAYTVPAGQVNISFLSQGTTLYNYTVQVPRLGNYTYYYTADNNTFPFVLSEANIIDPKDYIYGSNANTPEYQLNKVSDLDLSPDAGPIFFTVQTPLTGGIDTKLSSAEPDVTFKNTADYGIYDGTMAPTAFNVRLTSSRPDSLASKKVATIAKPFPISPAPGNYTVVAAGLLNTTDPAKKIRLFMVQHTNFTTKAK